MTQESETGLRPARLEFVRETTEAVTPANPAWLRYADNITNFSASFNPEIQEQRGIGSPFVNQFYTSVQEPECSITYDLQRFFVDAGGDPLDAAYDGMVRSASNTLPSSHTISYRLDQQNLTPGATVEADVNGVGTATAKDSREYFLLQGADIEEVTLTGNLSEQVPWSVELSYQAEIGRTYRVDQPPTTSLLTVRSTDPADTTQAVTLESDGAAVTDTLPLAGTTPVSTTNTYGSLDAIDLDEETVGDVIVSMNTGDAVTPAEGEALAVVYGSATYDGVEGDLGLPALGAGSHEPAIGTDYLSYGASTITYGGATPAKNVQSVEINVSNEIERTVRASTRAQEIHHGQVTQEASLTVDGENEVHRKVRDTLTGTTGDFVVTFGGGQTLTLNAARPTEAPEVEFAPDDVAVEYDWTLAASGENVGFTA